MARSKRRKTVPVVDSLDWTESTEDVDGDDATVSLSCFKNLMNLRLFVDSAASNVLVFCATASVGLDRLRKTSSLGIRPGSPRASEMVQVEFNGVSVIHEIV